MSGLRDREGRGGAATVGETDIAGASVGPPGYMAPEQLARAADADPCGDLYSVGVVACERLSAASLAWRHTERDPGVASQKRVYTPAIAASGGSVTVTRLWRPISAEGALRSGASPAPEKPFPVVGIRKTRPNVLEPERREIDQDLMHCHARSEVGQHVADRDARSAHRRLAEANLRIENDAVVEVRCPSHLHNSIGDRAAFLAEEQSTVTPLRPQGWNRFLESFFPNCSGIGLIATGRRAPACHAGASIVARPLRQAVAASCFRARHEHPAPSGVQLLLDVGHGDIPRKSRTESAGAGLESQGQCRPGQRRPSASGFDRRGSRNHSSGTDG